MLEQLKGLSRNLISEKIDRIYAPIEEPLERAENRLKTFFDDEPRDLIRRASQYLSEAGGKRIRPALVMLFAHASGRQDSGYNYPLAAAAVEIIHNATLIHDDVVDEAYLRRGVETVNEQWDNKTAVLVGDYLYSRALDEIVGLGRTDVVAELTRATRQMSRGELVSLDDQLDLDVTREEYFDIIRQKTASLMRAASFVGAAGSSAEREQAARTYGEKFGLAFQIIDDIIDLLSNDQEAGKNSFQDLARGKLTLPLIEAMQTSENGRREEVRTIMEEPMKLEQRRERLMPIIREGNGFERAGEVARGFAEEAHGALAVFPDNPSARSLRKMCEYVVRRNF